MRITTLLLCACLAVPGSLAAQSLPANMAADSAHAPFLHGVASFDPTADHVLLWTKVDPEGSGGPVTVHWEAFSDAALTQPVGGGTATASALTDWTASVDAAFPAAGRHYWYRWHDGQGRNSVVGRTKTAAAGAVGQVRLAVMSCSSVFSGFFNAYARVGGRDDLDLVVHLGDYIYDFVDEDEQVRVPVPAPVDPQTLAEWRERHSYYLLDPDLRSARQMHPWAAIWDNHDVDGDSPQHTAEAMQAFQEYLPMRLLSPAQPERIYRRLQYGDLLDLLLCDVTTLRDVDTLPNGEWSLLGATQWDWLSQSLTGSAARWRVIGQERMMAQFSTAGLGSLINYGDGPVADSGAWDGYNGERVRLLDLLSSSGIDDNVVLSGDIHTSFTCDLPIDYGSYDAQTGAGSVAVEFLPTSVTRGNFDEAGVSGFLAQLVKLAIDAANPHHVYSELTSHGYGILDIRPDTVTAEYWYSPILQQGAPEAFATGYQCIAGENHWRRTAVTQPTTVATDPAGEAAGWGLRAFPNPAGDRVEVRLRPSQRLRGELELIDIATGRVLRHIPVAGGAGEEMRLQLDLAGLPDGGLLLRIRTKDREQATHLLHIRP